MSIELTRNTADSALKKQLEKRSSEDSLRSLTIAGPNSIDFASNDYLGFSRSAELAEISATLYDSLIKNGSTGSRLLTGNSPFAEELEQYIANYHSAEAALIFNSGYDANVGLFSCIANRGDTILYDELSHASIIDGIRLSHANTYKFRHNDVEHLKELLDKATGVVYVTIESVYSMNGDMAHIKQIADLCEAQAANLILDEAHATGVFGSKGEGLVVELGLENKTFARIHTFGKALGVHGAAVIGSRLLRDYLINFSRSFIYTTALPPRSLADIKAAYVLLGRSTVQLNRNRELIRYYKGQISAISQYESVDSNSCIQVLIIGDNTRAKQIAASIQAKGFDVRAILSPTVAKGKERLRICLHSFNTEEQILGLIRSIADFSK